MTAILLSAGTLPAMAQDEGSFESEHEQEYRHEAFWSTHRDSQGNVRPDLWRKGIQDSLAIRAAQRSLLGVPPASVWVQIGPQPLRIDQYQVNQGTGPNSGEVVDLAIDPGGSSDQTVYIATNDGGIWKTTDGGSTWAFLTDTGCPDAMTQCPSLSMGAVALSHAGTVFAGTGNPFDGGGLFTKGVGIYRSRDGGTTWTIVSADIFKDHSINRIVSVLPFGEGEAEVLLVATDVGLFRSIDDGDHFGNNPPTYDNKQPVLGGNITDLKQDTGSAHLRDLNTVYAAVEGIGIFKSTDIGVTFPVNLLKNLGVNFSYITFTQSTRPNNNRFYANLASDRDNYLGLYRSDDHGANWTSKFALNLPSTCQCEYDLTIGVDPQDQDRLYVGFQELYLSTNGGFSFTFFPVTRKQVHHDHHALYFSPSRHWGSPPTRLWVGTDGGVASSTDGGTTWSNLNETIATNLFKHIDIGRNSAKNVGYTYGGMQDAGTAEHRPDFDGNNWHAGQTGDGSGVGVDPKTPTIAHGAATGHYTYTSNGGDNWSLTNSPLNTLPSAWRFAIDPNDGSNIFAATSIKDGFYAGPDLYRWKKGNIFAYSYLASFAPGIQSMANTPINSDLLWLGLTDGSMERCDMLLSEIMCDKIPDPSGTGKKVSGIFIVLTDPNDIGKDRVIAVYEGFSGMPGKHVYYTKDSGHSWMNISNTLPDLPTHSVYGSGAISNDAGVMFTNDLGSTWKVLGAVLPMVDSTQLAGSTCPPVLRLGTYGRSVWELRAEETGFYDDGPSSDSDPEILITGPGNFATDSFRSPGSSISHVSFDVWVPDTPFQVPMFVMWRITDEPFGGNLCASGNVAKLTYTLIGGKPGMNRFKAEFDITPVPLNLGISYFLQLSGFLTDMGGPGWWDQNFGILCGGSGTDLMGLGANCPSYAWGPGDASIPPNAFSVHN
jgi:photosystem II stability/assembly factor-like uncharacterized protein